MGRTESTEMTVKKSVGGAGPAGEIHAPGAHTSWKDTGKLSAATVDRDTLSSRISLPPPGREEIMLMEPSPVERRAHGCGAFGARAFAAPKPNTWSLAPTPSPPFEVPSPKKGRKKGGGGGR